MIPLGTWPNILLFILFGFVWEMIGLGEGRRYFIYIKLLKIAHVHIQLSAMDGMYRTHSFPKIATPNPNCVLNNVPFQKLEPQTLIVSWTMCLSKFASPNPNYVLNNVPFQIASQALVFSWKRGRNDINNSKGVFPKGAYTTHNTTRKINYFFTLCWQNFTTLLTKLCLIWLIAKGYIQQISSPPPIDWLFPSLLCCLFDSKVPK